ncbi:hypothetical protein ABQ333_04965 [Serratia fonticola]|uniref:hypothetical protein n=1 Tax=Serratia fonticola TaxID=47917 RepID=UPI003AAE8E20
MCEPATIALGSSLALSGLSAYSQRQQGKAAQQMANADADAKEIAGRDAINTSNAQAAIQRQQARQLQGAQAAAFGAGGTDMTSGSSLNIFGDTAANGALDSGTTITNGINRANGLNFQADMSRTQGRIDKQQANMGAGMTLLNAPLQAFGAYKTFGGGASLFNSGAKASGGASSGGLFDNLKKSNTAFVGNTGYKGPYTF